MTLLSAYLSNPKTRRVLSTKPGQQGFSLIELVVVIAVLAVLVAIALPNFLGVSDDAAARTAQQAAITAFKECQVFKARGQATSTTSDFERPSLNDFIVFAANASSSTSATAPATQAAADVDCFTTAGATRDVFAVPKVANKFPTFKVSASGTKACQSGTLSTGQNDKTYNTGCSGASGAAGEWQ